MDCAVPGVRLRDPSSFASSILCTCLLLTDCGLLQLQLSHPRSFTRRSSRISLGIASFYLCWILVCSHFNGVFPYPFLNKMPWPQVRVSCMHARATPLLSSATSKCKCTF